MVKTVSTVLRQDKCANDVDHLKQVCDWGKHILEVQKRANAEKVKSL